MNDLRGTGRKNNMSRSVAQTAMALGLLSIALLTSSCAPSLYRINIKYEPSKTAVQFVDMEKQCPITVATFNDARPGGDDLKVGAVVSNSDKIPIIPRNLKPSKAVATCLKEYLTRSGYTVTNVMPVWNLQEATIKKDWGGILIGGNIDKLEIVCEDKVPIKKYNAEVKLTFYFANVQTGKIFYTVSATGNASLEHVRFSEELLAQQMNGALSYAIEDIFGGNTVKTKILETLKAP